MTTPDDLKLRDCATCGAPVVTAAEMKRAALAALPPNVQEFGGLHRGRPHCKRCQKAATLVRPHPSTL